MLHTTWGYKPKKRIQTMTHGVLHDTYRSGPQTKKEDTNYDAWCAACCIPLALLVELLLLSIEIVSFVLTFLESAIFLAFCLFPWLLKFGWSYLDF